MLYQPSNVSPDQVNGTGTVDITAGLDVSWRVNGDSAMTAYKIDIYQNNAASTLVYSTGKVTLATPFWGVSYNGEIQYYTATIDAATLTGAGMSNGNEYKLLITQWWSADDSVQQYTASLFITRAVPTLTLTSIPDPVTSKQYSFTATYSQAQGNGMKWVQWEISEEGNESNPFVDTGPIYGTGELRVDYDGFLNGTTYVIRCTAESANGIDVTTGWVSFSVEYEVSSAEGSVSACMLAGSPCVWISWDQVEAADGYSIMRRNVNESRLTLIADVEATTGQIRDYSAESGQTYIYYVFPVGALSYLTEPMVSPRVPVQYWFWSIVEAEPIDDTGKNFSAVAAYNFRYGSGGVGEGTISNNNSPSVSANFTRYPTWQGTTPNYLTGSVSGYIGTISNDRRTYSDTIAQSMALYALSNTTNALFLVDPKGHFLRIKISSAISIATDHKKKEMPQTATVSWVEVGSTDGLHIIMYPGGDFYPVDRVILSTLEIDTATGALLWETPDDYTGTGSHLYLSDGSLMQNDDGPFNSATMTLDQSTGIVSAELGE